MGRVTRKVTIAAGGNTSGALFFESYRLGAIGMPAAWDTAQVTLRAAYEENGIYQPVYDRAGGEFVIVTAAGRHVNVSMIELPGLRWVRFRSGTNLAPVTQSAERIIEVYLTH